jgi:glycyl-tRNA synthetase
MAHYAADCWDAELLTSYGWIECVGCADRSAYDLSVHAKATKTPLLVREKYKEPRRINEYVVELDKKKFGPKFKKDGKAVQDAIDALTQEVQEKLSIDLKEKGEVEIPVPGVGSGSVTLDKDLVVIEKRERIEYMREYVRIPCLLPHSSSHP